MRLAEVPRHPLGTLPTPLERAEALSHLLGVEVLVKRDDLTGLGVGGNKVRPLEYLLADALGRRCDALVTGGGPHSNYAALAALAGARAGIEVHLVRYGSPPDRAVNGNSTLAELAGATVHHTGSDDRESVDREVEAVAEELGAAGRRPYVVPRGGATAVGCVGYVRASLELAEQLTRLGVAPTRVIVATGSCATQAGLEAGRGWLQMPYRVVGVTVSRPREESLRRVNELTAACCELLRLRPPPSEDAPVVLDGYIGPGYGRPSSAALDAIRFAARHAGVLLDPVFTGKAFAALRDTADEDAGPVVFWHTGGAVNTVRIAPGTEELDDPGL